MALQIIELVTGIVSLRCRSLTIVGEVFRGMFAYTLMYCLYYFTRGDPNWLHFLLYVFTKGFLVLISIQLCLFIPEILITA